MSLTPQEIERYARHIMLREIGGPGQTDLQAAYAVIVGAGALGGPAAMYLAAAGVGAIRIIDDDVVSLSNLQRQVLFQTPDVGQPKAEVAVERLTAINPHVKVSAARERVTAESAWRLIAGADIVLDGTDNFATRFIINETCHRLAVPLVSGAVGRWSAQVSVFRSGETKGKPPEQRLPCYRCLVSEMPETEETCAAVGVIGPLTGVVGARMALETVKAITGAGDTLAGKLWLFDGLTGDTRTVTLKADPRCAVCGG